MIHTLLKHVDVMADKNPFCYHNCKCHKGKASGAMFYNSTLAANMRIPDASGVVVNMPL